MAYFTDNPTAANFATGDLIPFSRSTTDYVVDADDILVHLTTDDLTEGATNLYYTNERVDDRVDALIQDGTGITWSYNDGAGTLTPTVSLSAFSTSNLAEASTILYVNKVESSAFTDAQIKALNTTPQIIVTSGGSNNYMFIGAILESVNLVTGYTNSGLDLVDATTGAVIASAPSTSISHTTTKRFMFMPAGTGPEITEGANIMLKATSADPTGGAAPNTLKVICLYKLVTFA